jgi:nucleolar MIF4G domain-containing protein 1
MKHTGKPPNASAKFSSFVSRRQTRKNKRKEERKLKKMRIHAFKQGKPLPTKESLEQQRRAEMKALLEKKKKAEAKRQKKLKRQTAEKKKIEVVEEKKSVLLEENRRDEQMLKQLEKNLGMKKRNKKLKKEPNKLPAAFVRDGLDFLLDVVDPDKMKSFK